jgi:hypothetical protein
MMFAEHSRGKLIGSAAEIDRPDQLARVAATPDVPEGMLRIGPSTDVLPTVKLRQVDPQLPVGRRDMPTPPSPTPAC